MILRRFQHVTVTKLSNSLTSPEPSRTSVQNHFHFQYVVFVTLPHPPEKNNKKPKQRKRKACVIAKALGNKTKFVPWNQPRSWMEPPKVGWKPPWKPWSWMEISMICYFKVITHTQNNRFYDRDLHGYTCCPCKFPVAANRNTWHAWFLGGCGVRKASRYMCVVNPCVLSSNTPGSHIFQGTHTRLTSWWLNQPICKISSSNWTISRQIGLKFQKTKIFEITNLWYPLIKLTNFHKGIWENHRLKMDFSGHICYFPGGSYYNPILQHTARGDSGGLQYNQPFPTLSTSPNPSWGGVRRVSWCMGPMGKCGEISMEKCQFAERYHRFNKCMTSIGGIQTCIREPTLQIMSCWV